MLIAEAILCLALNVYHEAKNQSLIGQIAVAQVVMNRVKDERYPDTVWEVVEQGPTYSWKPDFPVRNRCQFSWYCDGKHDTPSMGRMWQESKNIATYAMENIEMLDITDGATHYHADYIENPRWAIARHRTLQIDTHIFYNKNKTRRF